MAEPIAARRSARASRAGWIVAHSRMKTPDRKRGERMRCASSSAVSGTASSGTPSSRAASTSSSIVSSWLGVVETRIIPASRSQTSAPCCSQKARIPGTILSPARATASAPSSPNSSRMRGR